MPLVLAVCQAAEEVVVCLSCVIAARDDGRVLGSGGNSYEGCRRGGSEEGDSILLVIPYRHMLLMTSALNQMLVGW